MESHDRIIAALYRERDGYIRQGRKEHARLVELELEARGEGPFKRPEDLRAEKRSGPRPARPAGRTKKIDGV